MNDKDISLDRWEHGTVITEPEYVGTVIVPGAFTLPVMEWPNWFHRLMARLLLGWRYTKHD